MVSQLRSESWSVLELYEPHPHDIVITDEQILRVLFLLRRYALNDSCACPVDEGNREQPVQCAYCEASALLHEVTGEFV